MNPAVRAARRVAFFSLSAAVPALVSLSAGGCHGKASDFSTGGEVQPVPAPAPANLLAEGVITTPDATWQRLQRGVGGAAGLLPATLGGILCAATGLDARLGAEINGASPAYLVVGGDPALPSWVLAMRLIEERRARPLFEGVSAIFAARDAGAGVLELVALADKGRLAGGGGVVGIAPGGWVVVGSTTDGLRELAPYATRTLPTKTVGGPTGTEIPSISIDVPERALGGSIAGALTNGWRDAEHAMLEDDRALRDAHGGRAPDFGDPRAIVAVLDGWTQKKLGALRDLQGLHLAIEVGDADVSMVVTATPASPSGAASEAVAALHSGDIAPLGRVPRETLVALLTRDDGATRARDAADTEAALVTTLGARLTAPDAKRVHAAIDDWYGARGDWATIALTLTPTDREAVADVAASDPARASRGVREALDLLAHTPALREPFGAWLHVRDIKLGGADVPGGGRASVASFTTEAPSPFALAWTPSAPDAPASQTAQAGGSARAGELKLALGAAPLPTLASVPAGAALGDEPAIGAALHSLGPVAGAIVAQPGRSPGCNATGGVLAAWGTRPGQAAQSGQTGQAAHTAQSLWATVVASDSSLRCAAKMFF